MDTIKSPTLKGSQLVLRRVKKTDIKDRINCGRNDELTFMYGGEKKEEKPYTQADGEKWYAKQIARKPGWIIEYLGHCIGEVFLHQIDMNDMRARFAIGIFDSSLIGKGVGTKLLNAIEEVARNHGALKMFVYTNKGDDQVVNFYKKNGYEDAGSIKDYQYGRNNSAVFLLKHLTDGF